MTALARLARVRTLLTAVTLVKGALWGATAVVAAIILGVPALLSPLIGLPVAATALWLNRAVLSTREVALWLEGRVPALRYSLVTLAEGVSGNVLPVLERKVADTSWAVPVRDTLVRRLSLPVILLTLAIAGMLFLPPLSRRYAAPHTGTGGRETTRARAADPFRSFMVTVTPPPYSRQPRQRLERPEAVTSLVGSSIRVEGDGWAISTTMPDTATPLWLQRDGSRRLLVLLPVSDSVPEVELVIPARDTVLAEGSGMIVLSGSGRDDFGLDAAWFEYIVSSGEGENYTFRSGVVGRRSLANAGRTEVASRISLDSLRLAPGNVVHLRAVARDGNSVSGPGIGYSETRTIRIPRPGEGDSVSVGQVARAEGDSSLLSQRMLVMMAEALERRRPRLGRDTFVSESRRIAGEQATLRRRVADIIFLRLGAEGSMEESEDSTAEPLTPEALLEAAEQATVTSGGETLDFKTDETPVVALNRPLLEAYNAMWAAGRELEIGEPRRALPHMREALEAIQRARQAERIYLRGRPLASVIDLAKVRLAGNLADAAPAPGVPASRDWRIREALLARYSRAIALLPANAVVDSLQLLRIDALEQEPRFAAALGEVVAALRSGNDATGPLITARRLLAGPLESRPGLGPWGMAP
jgi:hypothetical protein